MSWDLINLNSVCRPRQWKTLSMDKLQPEGFPVYGANGKIGFYSEYTHELPTLAITCRGATCGSVHITDPMSYINGNAMALDNVSEAVDIKFLYYFFQFRGFNDVISGSAQPQITGEGLSKVQIPLPPLETQKRIAEILDAADALRQKDQELLKKYDELAQAIFIDMFGDPVKNEKGWEITDLKNTVHQDRIVTYGIVQAGKHVDDGIPYIRTGDIKNGEILINQLQKTSREIAESYNRSKLYLNDIIMSIRATVGTVALLPDSLVGANLTQGTARISPSDKVNRLYLYYFLKNDFAQNWINENSKGATFREITLTKLRDLPVLLPPLRLQNQFGNRISNILISNNFLKKQIESSSDFFQSLIQKAFKGELI